MTKEHHEPAICSICGQNRHRSELMHSEIIRPAVIQVIRKAHPAWSEHELICHDCLHRFRSDHVQALLEADKGELSSLEAQVIRSLREHELLARNVNSEFEGQLALGDRIADKVASFGGSWRFIIIFGAVLAGWVAFNSLVLLHKAFDPYPFILLNLVLSCLAAIQAPVIMMSQNRQEAKDRLRAEHDYRINLKAELEIRLLHSKFDQLLSHQWQRLVEIQQVQMDILEEIAQEK